MVFSRVIMARHNELGKQGEERVACYLQDRGFRILDRNWRVGHRELDFVCLDGETVVVVEVKTRTTDDDHPAELLDRRKRRNLQAAGEAYLTSHHLDREIRFDLIVVFAPDGRIAYYPEIIDLF